MFSGESGAAPIFKAVPTPTQEDIEWSSTPTDARPEPKGTLCAQDGAFNLHAATGRAEPGVAGFRRVAPNDKQGREMLCRYILRPPASRGQ